MNVSDDLEQAAVIIDGEADDLRSVLRPVTAATGPEVLAGGTLAESLDEFLDLACSVIEQVAKEWEDEAARLRRLAEEKRQLVEDLQIDELIGGPIT